MSQTITRFEFEPIYESDLDNFSDLENYILEGNNNGADALELMSLSATRNKGKMIVPKNYVGVIGFKNGTSIEILPKIGKDNDTEKTKKVFIDLLKEALDLPYKEFDKADLNTWKLNIYELFIRAFIIKTNLLLRNGLCRTYYDIESNERFLKGKLDFAQNIKYNLSHEERFYVRHQFFGEDRPENRLIKTTVMLLYSITKDSKNKKALNDILFEFESVDMCVDVDDDLKHVVVERSTDSYRDTLKWCEIFLHNKSFTTFTGHNIAYSFLFPMDRLYEQYVAKRLEKRAKNGITLRCQDGSTSLFDGESNTKMRPDIIATKNGKTVIIDTKWKLLNSIGDVSSSDFYQAYVYSIKFGTIDTILLYPRFNSEEKDFVDRSNSVNVLIRFIDMYDLESSINDLSETLNFVLGEME